MKKKIVGIVAIGALLVGTAAFAIQGRGRDAAPEAMPPCCVTECTTVTRARFKLPEQHDPTVPTKPPKG